MLKRGMTLALAVSIMTVSCKPDPAERLAKLQKQDAEIRQEISALRKQLNLDNQQNKNIAVVTAATIAPTNFQHYIEVQGRVESDENVWIVPKVPGVMITSVRVQRGQAVHKGEVMASLDASMVEQNLAALRSQVSLAETAYKKRKALWDQQIGSEMEYLNAKTQMETMQRQMAAAQEGYANYTIRAPFDGVVDDITLHEGELANPANGIKVVNYAKTRVVADVSEAYISKIEKGNAAIVSFPDLNKDINTTIKTVGRVVNPSGRTFLVELGVDAQALHLSPNLVAVVKINDYSKPNSLVAPLNAVQRDDNGVYVYVVSTDGKNKIAKRTPVKTGETYGDQTEILSGLNAGDQIITSGYQNLADGQPVNL